MICASCSREKSHKAKGLCASCYNKSLRLDPGTREARNRVKRNWYHKNKDRLKTHFRDRHFKQKYDLSLSEVQALSEKQGGACAICNVIVNRLVVDHNHETGAVRSMLCNRCNTALSGVEDKIWLEKALKYLEDHANTN